jgi:hypothetical protein
MIGSVLIAEPRAFNERLSLLKGERVGSVKRGCSTLETEHPPCLVGSISILGKDSGRRLKILPPAPKPPLRQILHIRLIAKCLSLKGDIEIRFSPAAML